jgi:hypothetical protein
VEVKTYAGPWRVYERTDPVTIDRRMALPGFGPPGITVNIPRPDVVRLVIGRHTVYLNVDNRDGINEDPVVVADRLGAEIDSRLRRPGSQTLILGAKETDGDPPPG